MATAGRILIMPKGNWKAETEYEMLDLVYYNGVSWVARTRVAKGIEPTEANSDYWQMMAGDGMQIVTGSTVVECSEGTTGYSIDVEGIASDRIKSVIHYIGEPTSWDFGYANLFQKNNTEGVIKTDAPNSFYVNYVAFYK